MDLDSFGVLREDIRRPLHLLHFQLPAHRRWRLHWLEPSSEVRQHGMLLVHLDKRFLELPRKNNVCQNKTGGRNLYTEGFCPTTHSLLPLDKIRPRTPPTAGARVCDAKLGKFHRQWMVRVPEDGLQVSDSALR